MTPPIKAALILCAAGLSIAQATEVATDPVGAVRILPLPQSDTVFSLPLHRSPVFEGPMASSTGTTVTITNSPGWTPDQFVYAVGTQSNTFYTLIASGTFEGRTYKINSNTQDALNLELNGDSLAGIEPESIIRIIPYWTFGTLFPNGEGVSPSTSHGNRSTEILVADNSDVGINYSLKTSYYYFSGANPGWRLVGGGFNNVRNDDILKPNSFLVYREKTSNSNNVIITGSVQMSATAQKVRQIQAGVRQDIRLAFDVAAPISLKQTGLVESGVFSGTSSHGNRLDELLVFSNQTPGLNKSPTAGYYYFTGNPQGWRKIGGGFNTLFDNEPVINPGDAFIIRKGSVNPTGTDFVTTLPPYLE